MERHQRAAKRRALEIIVGSHSSEDEDIADDSDSDRSIASADSVQGMNISCGEENLPDDDVLSEDVVYWCNDDGSDDPFPNFPPPLLPPEQSRDGNLWTAGQPSFHTGRVRRENVYHGVPYQIKRGINPQTEKESLLIFLDDIVQKSVLYTNLQARRKNIQNNKQWCKTDEVEMEAFYGLLILAGAYKAQYRATEELWSEKEGQAVFRATMSRKRFKELKCHLRFDDCLRRNTDDPLAPVRDVTMKFISSLREYVLAPPFLCIDEQLLEYHGRVRFRQYIPSKPGKFGIKIIWLTDSNGHYCFNGVIYIGSGTLPQSEISQSLSIPEATVMHLMKPFCNNGRHLTGDNWFSSVRLVERLLEASTTYIGTMRSNLRCVPSSMTSTTERQHGDTKFVHNDTVLLVSFYDKKSSPVILIDSFHGHYELPAVGTKPLTVRVYNEHKSGVDTFDKKIRAFSCKRKCRRWPFGFVCNLVDIACINAMFLYKRNPNPTDKTYHYQFLKNVGYQLVDGLIQRRLAKKSLKQCVISAMKVLGYEYKMRTEYNSNTNLDKPRRCQLCPYSKDKKSKCTCSKCHRVMCAAHRAFICSNCVI